MCIRGVTSCVLVLGLAVVVGCSQSAPRIYAPAIDASSAGTEAVEMYGKDGMISGSDLDKCPALKAALAQIDTDGDGTITDAEITARIEKWQESKLGRMAFKCVVLRNGIPLAGADVKFVPETFLGDAVQAASGKTAQDGVAVISVPTANPPGVAPGLYRVEITKTGENIPAKYNTNTTLGQEVALNAEGMQKGVKFNLQY